MDELKKKIEEIASAFEAFKKANDESIAALKKSGTVDPTIQAKVDKANDDIQKLTKERDDILVEIKNLQTAFNRPGSEKLASDAEKKMADLQKKAFSNYLRRGENGMKSDELEILRKAMSDDSQPDGGYLVRPEISARIISKIYETSPMRELATVETIGTDALEMPADLDQTDAGWVAERGARNVSASPQLKWIRIPAQELYSMPKATQRQLDDAMWDVESWLARKIADRLSRLENTAFISGTGVGQPRGLLTYANDTSAPNDANKPFGVIQQVVSGNANLLTADGLLSLFYALKEAYQANATWVMQRATVLAVRKLKDGFGRYLWEPSLTVGAPDMLVGRPVRQFADMNSVSAGLFPVAVGDFKEAYQIVDRAGIRVLRDPFTAKPFTLFYTTKRVGGDVVNFEAVKLQVIST